ncbi:phage protein [Microvirgula aerodenitrificans]|uniref:phage protein n=1 Tax=Microvirgula aerodenitrificans TaxID=57480 RepID=UPI0028E80F31|nr:hypothetical protein [Microvirgula aerodenitrificans]
MSTKQWIRKISLRVGNDEKALDLSQLRVRFNVRRGDVATPNTASIRVYNVSDKTARSIQSSGEFNRVRLEAGYEDSFGVIFDGTITQVRIGRESQTDTYVDLSVADGDSAYNFAIINKSLAAGSTADEQVDVLASAMEPHGVTQGYRPELSQNKLPRGKVMFGGARDYLSSIMRDQEAKWSIQNGKMTIIPFDNFIPSEAIEITSETGMIGLPESTIGGLNLSVLINPRIRIGTLVHLNNSSIQKYEYSSGVKQSAGNSKTSLGGAKINDDGLYYVMVSEYVGDTHGQEWYSRLTCLAVDATSIPEQVTNKASTTGVIMQSPDRQGPIKY